MKRKPLTEVEIIDECDEFLDSLANSKKINLTRLFNSLNYILPKDEKQQDILKNLTEIVKKTYNAFEFEKIYDLNKTSFLTLIQFFLDNPISELTEDEESYLYYCEETALNFEEFLDETYFSCYKEDKDTIITLVTPNLEKKFKEIEDNNKVLILMSGTLHSTSVLENIFGIKDYKIIEAETKLPGNVLKKQLGLEFDCKYENYKKNREYFLKVLSKCVESSEKPCVVHLTSFQDLPFEKEKKKLKIENLPTQNKIRREQERDRKNKNVQDFKKGLINILFTTKCNRGVDFPGETCKSTIITRFPYPNISSLFWKIFKKNYPSYWKSFYLDKSKRELCQKVYRAVRFKGDKVTLLSPDLRVFKHEF